MFLKMVCLKGTLFYKVISVNVCQLLKVVALQGAINISVISNLFFFVSLKICYLTLMVILKLLTLAFVKRASHLDQQPKLFVAPPNT